MTRWFESSRIWAAGLIVSELCDTPSHWSQVETLNSWMVRQGIPGIQGIDTRQLTKIIREKGTMLGKIFVGDDVPAEIAVWDNPNHRNLVQQVSLQVTFISSIHDSIKSFYHRAHVLIVTNQFMFQYQSLLCVQWMKF